MKPIFDWLCKKYVQRADDRQKSLGLQYTEAETSDLAENISRDLVSPLEREVERLRERVSELESDEPEWSAMQQKLGDQNQALRAQLTSAHTGQTWLPLESAPKDGTIVTLLVQFDDHWLDDAGNEQQLRQVTIGQNLLRDTGEDVWDFVGWSWSVDCFTNGSGKVLAWKPFNREVDVIKNQLRERHADQLKVENE